MKNCADGHIPISYETDECPFCEFQDRFERLEDSMVVVRDILSAHRTKTIAAPKPIVKKEGKLIEFPSRRLQPDTTVARKKHGRVLPISNDTAS